MDNDKTQILEDGKNNLEVNIGGGNNDKFQDPNIGEFTTISEDGSVANPTKAERTIIGMLISRSKKGNAEFWPVAMGKNKIGSNLNNDIILLEQQVSGEHAILFAKRNLETNALQLSIVDVSSNGILVDGKDPGTYTGIPCHNESKIKIGRYELVLLYADTDKLGLKVNPEFKPIGEDRKAFSPNASSTAIDYD